MAVESYVECVQKYRICAELSCLLNRIFRYTAFGCVVHSIAQTEYSSIWIAHISNAAGWMHGPHALWLHAK